jgi:hypothetical protein
MLFQYFALLDRFNSDIDELDLSFENKTLKIGKIPKEKLRSFLLSPKPKFPSINEAFEVAIDLGEDMYWVDYHYEVEDSKEAMIRANNIVDEDIAKVMLVLRLFREGCIRIVFDVWRGKHIATHFSSIRPFRNDERLYFLPSSSLLDLRNFREEFMNTAWEKKESSSPLGIALSRFTDGYERIKLEDKIIDYVIALEALYLQEGTAELSYRLAHRVSVLLTKDKKERQRLFKMTGRSYDLRSKIVHGSKYDLSHEKVWFVEDTLRRSIREFLKTPKPNWLRIIF